MIPCSKSDISIFQVNNGTKLCGELNSTHIGEEFLSTDNTMTVKLISDYGGSYSGFIAEYTQTGDGPGGTHFLTRELLGWDPI